MISFSGVKLQKKTDIKKLPSGNDFPNKKENIKNSKKKYIFAFCKYLIFRTALWQK